MRRISGFDLVPDSTVRRKIIQSDVMDEVPFNGGL